MKNSKQSRGFTSKGVTSKGFTLVEIVVVLSITTIVFGIISSIIVFSMGMFRDGTFSVQEKISTEELVGLLESEVSYSSEIVVSSGVGLDDDWYCFYISDGMLIHSKYQGGNYTTLSSFSKLGNLDLEKTTLDVECNNRSIIVYISETKYVIPLYNISSLEIEKTGIRNGIKLFYKKDRRVSAITDTSQGTEDSNTPSGGTEEPPIFENTGTIADQIRTISPESNRGKLEDLKAHSQVYFFKYDAIYVDGYWWVFLMDGWGGGQYRPTNTLPPNFNSLWWKKLSIDWDKYSAYEKGDIVVYNSKYYRCKQDIINYGGTIFEPGSSTWGGEFWEEISENELPSDGSSNISVRNTTNTRAKETVISKLGNWSNDELLEVRKYDDSILDSIPVCSSPSNPRYEDIWMMVEENPQTGGIYFSYYIRVNNYGVAPNEKTSDGHLDWQKLSVDYSDYSVYYKGDVSYFGQNGLNSYMKCLSDYDTYYDRGVHNWTAPYYIWGLNRWESF